MKKVIFAAMAFLLSFSLSAFAAASLTVSPDSINMEASEGDTVIYTPAFGDTILSGEVNDEHGFKDYYALTVVPRTVINDESVDVSEDISNTVSDDISDGVSDDVSDGISDDVSDNNSSTEEIIPPIISGDATETASVTDYEYKVSAVYVPGTADKDISIPDDGFVIVFPGSKLGDVSGDDITVGAPVALYGINLETPSVDEGAYVEIDLSNRGLLGDIPQTSDSGMIAVFAVVAVISGVAAFGFYKKSKKSVEE